MLTKDLLKTKVRNKSIQPQLISPDDPDGLQLAGALLQVMRDSQGLVAQEIEGKLKKIVEVEGLDYGLGFIKILLDHSEFSEPDFDFETARWEWVLSAQALRQEQYLRTYGEFQETFANAQLKDFSHFKSMIYGDLPEFRSLSKTIDWDARTLLLRYNCALVQSLLTYAPKIHIKLHDCTAIEKRSLFRSIRFHRLIVGNIESQGSQLSFELDGPLSLLTSTQAYGMRLANFFPRLLLCKKWQLDAEIKLKKETHVLVLNACADLLSHYKDWGGYQPEELLIFLTKFNETSSSWHCEWADEFVPLDAQHFCFPDMKLGQKECGKVVFLEFFHSWHKGELEKRLKTLQKRNNNNMIIGVCNSLFKGANMGPSLIQDDEFERFGFTFRGVPSPTAVMKLLNKMSL